MTRMVKQGTYAQLLTRRVPLPWTLALALGPLVAAGIFVLVVNLQRLTRYDPAYFTPAYTEKYHTPGSVARALEVALQEGDATLYAELSGLRNNPRTLEAKADLGLAILWDVDEEDYFHYLYVDYSNYKRDMQYIKEVDERWVVVPQGAYFLLDSGRWLGVFLPTAVTWWLLVLVREMIALAYQASARLREAMYG